MVDITPGVAFLAALQNQFNAARQGQGQGTNSLIPGLPSGQLGDPNSVFGTPLGFGGISLGGVPGTATTGAGIAAGLGGGIGGDPIAQQVAALFGSGNSGLLGSREPGERGDFGTLNRPNDPFGPRLDIDPVDFFGRTGLAAMTGGAIPALIEAAKQLAAADELPVRGPGSGEELMNALNRPGGLGFPEREIDERDTAERNRERFGNERQPQRERTTGRATGRV